MGFFALLRMTINMKPPFFGTKVVGGANIREVVNLINREVLFASRWQFRKGQTANEWEKFKQTVLTPIFEKLISLCESHNLIEPKLIYGYFECRRQENALLITPSPPPSPAFAKASAGKPTRGEGESLFPSPSPARRRFSGGRGEGEGGGGKLLRFEFPRQRQSPHLCISDFFPDGFITMQIATIGSRVIEEGVRLFKEKKYSEVFFLKGLAAEFAEATAEYGHRLILKELGVAAGVGCRFSFGYPALPNLMNQEKLYTLLDGGRIGVKLTETFYLVPEYSTSAIISFDPKACHFRP